MKNQISPFQRINFLKLFSVVLLLVSFSNKLFSATVTGAPTAVSASIVSSTSAKVNFITYSNTLGTGTISYKVTATPGGLNATGTATGITVTGLTA